MSKDKVRDMYEEALESKQYIKLTKLFVKHWYFVLLYNLAGFIGKYMGLSKLGYANTLKLSVNKFNLYFPELPEGFDNYKILFFSDFHFDNNIPIAKKLAETVKSLDYNVILSGGDYKAEHQPDYERLEKLFADGFSTLKNREKYSVSGNHDNDNVIEMLKDKFTFLDNASVLLRHNDSYIRLVGIDDCHFFHAEDLNLAFKEVKRDEFVIFLSHSPEIYNDAEKYGANLMLCGHTHGGQICLPGGIPILGNVGNKRSVIKQEWKHRKMKGFTTNGVGTSLLPVRFNCPPEVCLITLKKGYGA